MIILTGSLKQFRLDRIEAFEVLKKRVRVMPLNGCREANHVEVVQCALFATRNSLKSHEAEKPFSPYRNTRAISPKLHKHSRPIPVENHPALQSRVALNSP